MWEFLTWVWWQALKVYYWFSDKFWEWVDRVVNFFTYLSDWTKSIWHAVTDYVTAFISAITKAIYDYIQTAINAVVNTVLVWLGNIQIAVDRAVNWILSKISELTDYVNRKVEAVMDTLDNLVQSVYDELYRVADTIRQWLYDLISPIVALYPAVKNLVQFFTTTALQRLATLIFDGYQTLITFIANPLECVAGLLQPVLIDLLDYTIGRAMGAERDTLPDISLIDYLRGKR